MSRKRALALLRWTGTDGSTHAPANVVSDMYPTKNTIVYFLIDNYVT